MRNIWLTFRAGTFRRVIQLCNVHAATMYAEKLQLREHCFFHSVAIQPAALAVISNPAHPRTTTIPLVWHFSCGIRIAIAVLGCSPFGVRAQMPPVRDHATNHESWCTTCQRQSANFSSECSDQHQQIRELARTSSCVGIVSPTTYDNVRSKIHAIQYMHVCTMHVQDSHFTPHISLTLQFMRFNMMVPCHGITIRQSNWIWLDCVVDASLVLGLHCKAAPHLRLSAHRPLT